MTEHDDSINPPPPNPAPRFSIGSSIGLFLRGIAMGAADVVPGVSGGTIAFITGIYERFVDALKSVSPRPLVDLVRSGPRAGVRSFQAIHWATLLPLALGIVLAFVVLSGLILTRMEESPGPMYALFFGLIAASAWLPIARIKALNAKHVIAILIAAIGAFFIVGLNPGGSTFQTTAHPDDAARVLILEKVRTLGDVASADRASPGGLGRVYFDPDGVLVGVTIESLHADAPPIVLATEDDLLQLSETQPALAIVESVPPALPYVFICGVIAISAMILPGLSGSFLLLLLGAYTAIFGSLHRVIDQLKGLLGREPDFLTTLSARNSTDDALLVGVFLVGVLIGLALFSRVVSWLFDHAHDLTMAALTGLMIGALRLPFEEVMKDPERANAGSYWAIVVGVAILGAVVVLALNITEKRLEARRAE